MVSFRNDKNQAVLLAAEGYQFPDYVGDEKFDGNWLQISIEVIDGRKSWKNTDPFLLTYDWLTIARWFSGLAEFRRPSRAGLGFLEPNLAFQFVRFDCANGRVNFDMELSLECTPPFCKGNGRAKYGFSFTAEQCWETAEMCRKEYEKFPERS